MSTVRRPRAKRTFTKSNPSKTVPFPRLLALMCDDKEAYDDEVRRLQLKEPERLDAFLDYLRREDAKATEADSRPYTPEETDDLLAGLATQLGWSRERVLEEAAFSLLDRVTAGGFRPLTTGADPAARKEVYFRYLRPRDHFRSLVCPT